MLDNSKIVQRLYQQAVKEAQNIIDGKPNMQPPAEPSTTTKQNSHLKEKWISRGSKNTNLNDLGTQTILLTYKCRSKDLNTIAKFEHVYSIVGDHLSAKPSRTGCYLCDITAGKYLPDAVNTRIYRGVYTHKTKTCQKLWLPRDIRSFTTIDESIYTQYLDLNIGMVPTIVGASILYIVYTHPNHSVALYGADLADLPAVDQQIIKDNHIRICM
jgi:hypothetical protein